MDKIPTLRQLMLAKKRIEELLGSYARDAAGGSLNPELTPENLRTAGEYLSMTPNPIGDVVSGMLAVDDLRKGDYFGAAGNAVGMIPFIPGIIGKRIPKPPGESSVPEGYVRLYHQTTPEALVQIEKEGIKLSKAKGIEGPRGIYADEKGFYGNPEDYPTVEFSVRRDKWQQPFVLDDVRPSDILGVHEPWHRIARYLLDPENKTMLDAALSGRLDKRGGDTAKAVEYVKELTKQGQ